LGAQKKKKVIELYKKVVFSCDCEGIDFIVPLISKKIVAIGGKIKVLENPLRIIV
jgi:hypothetical protein